MLVVSDVEKERERKEKMTMADRVYKTEGDVSPVNCGH